MISSMCEGVIRTEPHCTGSWRLQCPRLMSAAPPFAAVSDVPQTLRSPRDPGVQCRVLLSAAPPSHDRQGIEISRGIVAFNVPFDVSGTLHIIVSDDRQGTEIPICWTLDHEWRLGILKRWSHVQSVLCRGDRS